MSKIITAGLLLFVASLAHAEPGESIVLDPAGTGNYIITYKDEENDDGWKKAVFIPSTKISPAISCSFKREHDDDIHYTWLLKNGRDSVQEIDFFFLDPVSSVTTPLPDVPLNTPPITPSITFAEVARTTDAMDQTANYFDSPALWEPSMSYSEGQQSFMIGWSSVKNMIKPGGHTTFGLKSRDLPGIILGKTSGYVEPGSSETPGENIPEEVEDEYSRQLLRVLFWRNFVPVPAAVPMISVAKPFDAAHALRQLKENVAKWPDMMMKDDATWPHMNLIDNTTATAIINNLQTAIVELDGGHNDAAIRTLKSIRSDLNQMLSNGKLDSDSEMSKDHKAGKKDPHKAEQAEANRKLVSEVLQFDLKYISRALGSHEGDDDLEDH